METKQKEILALMVINDRGVQFSNSYSLIRVLEWKFGIIETREILEGIRNSRWVDYDIINGLYHYRLNNDGKKWLEENRSNLVNQLRIEFPESLETIFGIK